MKVILTGLPKNLKYIYGIAYRMMKRKRLDVDVVKDKFDRKELLDLDRNSLLIIVKCPTYIKDVDLPESPTKPEMIDAILEANSKDKKLSKVSELEAVVKEKTIQLKESGDKIIALQDEANLKVEADKAKEAVVVKLKEDVEVLEKDVSDKAAQIIELNEKNAKIDGYLIAKNDLLITEKEKLKAANKEITALKKQIPKAE